MLQKIGFYGKKDKKTIMMNCYEYVKSSKKSKSASTVILLARKNDN